MHSDQNQKTVGLFVTCLVDLMRPSVGWACVKLLEDQGFQVEVPQAQTCCGQPAYNSGDRQTAKTLGKNLIRAFESFDYVVVPSGSCAGMICHHLPDLFGDEEADWATRARKLASRCFELTAFLSDVVKDPSINANFDTKLTYHDSCSSLRDMKVKHQPRSLLDKVQGVEIAEMEGTAECCGFGGTFCVKYPEISNKMVSKKVENAINTHADILVAADLGCCMNIAGKAKRDGHVLKVRHVAEILVGDTDTPAIGEA